MTIATLKNHPANKIFFNNAKLHGDKSYHYNDARKELTIKMQDASGLKRTATWHVEQDGKIGDVITNSVKTLYTKG